MVKYKVITKKGFYKIFNSENSMLKYHRKNKDSIVEQKIDGKWFEYHLS